MLPSEQFDSTRVQNESKGIQNGDDEWDGTDIGLFGSNTGFFEAQGSAAELGYALSENEIHRQIQDFKEFCNDLYVDVVSPPFQSCDDDEIRTILGISSQSSEQIEVEQEGSYVLMERSFELLRRHGGKRLRSDGEKSNADSQTETTHSRGLMMSTEKIIELATENFIQSMSKSKEISLVRHPYPSSMTLARSADDLKAVQLVHNLLLSAEKVDEKKYERARKLLEECDRMSSSAGTPIQRLVFYFTEALYEKMDRETGSISPRGMGKKILHSLEDLQRTNRFRLSLHKNQPLSQIAQFAGMQTVIEHVAEARKVHVIDLGIRSGLQCTILMQALAARQERHVQHLRITAVGTRSRPTIEKTGRQLMAFAESLNLNFSFHIVMVTDILDLNERLFELDADEAVAVYSAYTLMYMIGQADWLEHIMRVIKSIRPCVMIVTELEANTNSPAFVRRFVEALFFYGVFFDSTAECLKNDERIRKEGESTCFSSSIRDIVAAEESERKIRHVRLNVWRAFFARFGLAEVELGMSSLYQANLVRQGFPSGGSCTLGMNGKCLTIGWKGTPLCTVSAWKFLRDSDV
ncbi:Scarecrow-like protein 18 [Sesamum alatum]|uniref:Scarecrow-like protein 18 n=1 Tax=Sesamum alatum TaxID=300844 RepID=A0AAE1YPL4_9LAMI|nr:Scarecrow-like protein 18 [Sesamum alatum]